MSLLDRLKLQKLKIHGYKTRARSGKPAGTFEAMFNPASLNQKYEIRYTRRQGTGTTGFEARYIRSQPRALTLKLILDGSGVHEMGILKFGKQKSVSERVKDFLDLAYRMAGSQHEPAYLLVEWGDVDWGEQQKGSFFSCRLLSVDIAYTSFQRDGSPLRAELDLSLISDIEAERRAREEKKKSPDLTHRRIVRAGDTLPLLCQEIYGQAGYYLRVAQANQLDNFRRLTPGQELIFPPLEK